MNVGNFWTLLQAATFFFFSSFVFGSAGSLIPFSQQWEKNWPHSTTLLSHKAESEAILHHRKGGRPYLEQIHIHSSHECVTIKAALDLCQVDSITQRRIHGFPVDLATADAKHEFDL